MGTFTLLRRNLAWYWRTNLAVIFGVATAVGVLAGALLVGDSVRASLRELFLQRIGNADYVISRAGFFREELASAFAAASPLIALDGAVTHEASGRRALEVQVYGVDERFWKFQGGEQGPPVRMSSGLAQELGARPGDAILFRVVKPSAIPLESLHGRKEDLGRTIRFAIEQVEACSRCEFSIRPQQGSVRAIFVPLRRLQRDLGQAGKVNTILVSGSPPEKALKDRYSLEDLGIRIRVLEKQHCLSLESDTALIDDGLAARATATAQELGMRAEPILTYLANSIRVGQREIPYSVVTAMNGPQSFVLNEWAARELGAQVGDPVRMEYYVWKDDGRLQTESAEFQVTRIVPLADDPDLAPQYPGITESESLHDWDPPFPIDLGRVRPIDEAYWKQYRTTPKAFIPLARGQELWQTRFGKLTSIRITPPELEAYRQKLREQLDPARMGLSVLAAKAQGLEASRGATDFGEYFFYFSFFLMASALLLTGLFFKLGVEQRLREIGILRALGFPMARIRSVFLGEGLVLAIVGTFVGLAGSLAYGALIMLGLRTWWMDAVGTRLLALHISILALAGGAAAGIATGLGCIAWTLRGLHPVTPRGLVAGEPKGRAARVPVRLAGAVSGLAAAALLSAALLKKMEPVAAFFGAGTLFLIAFLCFERRWFDSRSFASLRGLFALGFRNATYRPGRSILCIALTASATFIIVSVDVFRRDSSSSGTGGYPLMAESVLPLIHNPNTDADKNALNLPKLPGVHFVSFRLKPGDDASCLNLYQPRNPRIVAPPADFLRSARFGLRDWTLLESPLPGGAIPAIADANSIEYSLHVKLGEDFVLNGIRFRIVAALEDSLFQAEMIISEQNFLRLFPQNQGYRFFLIDAPPQNAAAVTGILEDALSDYGFDVVPTLERLAGFHRVENTYISTFQTLGALGLVLGTLGLAAVLLRNVLERRRELALLRAVGYRWANLATLVIAENALLLLLGLGTGGLCALLAVAPAFSSRGGHFSTVSLGVLLAAVLITGLIASLLATAAALRSPLLAALRSE